jgi:hypothetical protein
MLRAKNGAYVPTEEAVIMAGKRATGIVAQDT